MRPIVLCLVFLTFSTLAAQPGLRFWHLNNSDGLSGTKVNSIMQDQNGFIWIGTDFGLNMYDAKSIIAFKHNAKDSLSIPGNIIKRIIEDKKGMKWIVTDGGICNFNMPGLKFNRYDFYEGDKRIKAINDLFLDSKNNLWIATDENGWGKADILNRKYLRERFNNQNQDTATLRKVYAVQAISEDRNGILYFGSRAYSLIINKQNAYFFTNGKRTAYPFPAHTINTIFCDSKNRIWIGAWDNALHYYDEQKNRLQEIFPGEKKTIEYSGNEITCINEDRNNRLWIGTKNGLYIYNPINGQIFYFTKNRFDKTSISNNSIRCIYRDKEDRMWIGTDSGVDIYDPLLNQFEITYLENDFASTNVVNDFLENGNNLFIATNDGLYANSIDNRSSERKTFYYVGEKLNITKLFRDTYGTIYLGTNKTVLTLDPKNFSIKTLNTFYNRRENNAFDFYNIASSRIISMAQSRWQNHDVLWISPIGHGLVAYNIKTKTGFVTPVFGRGQRFEHMINKIFIDAKQNIFCLNNRNGISQNFTRTHFADSIFNHPGKKQKTILADYVPLQSVFLDEKISNMPGAVFDMLEIGSGEYWITSTTEGLFRLDINKNRVEHFENSHPNMYGMERDENGNLWIITSSGIEFFNTARKSFYHFGKADGIPDEGLQGYFYKNKEGYLFAGGKGYFLKFKPENIQFNLTKPATAITHFRIFDQIADSLMSDKTIHLSYSQNHFSFEFAALNYTNAPENQFQYKLDGLDEKWISSGSRNYVSYTNLNGGDYLFNIKSSNNNSIWSDPVTVAINIKPPLWQYSWFYPALVLLLVAVGFFIYRKRIKSIHRIQTEKLLTEIDAQEKERRRIARDLHDEFGTKMSALKIYLSTYEKFIDHQNQEALKTKNELYAIVDDSMHDLRSLLMDLSPKTLEMHGFASALNDLATRLSNTHLFQIKCYVARELEKFEPKYELTIFRITQELINNSIRHAECKEISIQLFYRDNNIFFSYEDDGKGFNIEDTRSTGHGLKNIQTRVSLLGGKINWDSSIGNGINVNIEIPFK